MQNFSFNQNYWQILTISACCRDSNETHPKVLISAIEGLLLTDARSEMIQRVHSNHEKKTIYYGSRILSANGTFCRLLRKYNTSQNAIRVQFSVGSSSSIAYFYKIYDLFCKVFYNLYLYSHPVHNPCMSTCNLRTLCAAVYTMSCTILVCPIFSSAHTTLGSADATLHRTLICQEQGHLQKCRRHARQCRRYAPQDPDMFPGVTTMI